MHFNHANNNLIILASKSLNINEFEKILVNISIILLFVFVNPFYALIICGENIWVRRRKKKNRKDKGRR